MWKCWLIPIKHYSTRFEITIVVCDSQIKLQLSQSEFLKSQVKCLIRIFWCGWCMAAVVIIWYILWAVIYFVITMWLFTEPQPEHIHIENYYSHISLWNYGQCHQICLVYGIFCAIIQAQKNVKESKSKYFNETTKWFEFDVQKKALPVVLVQYVKTIGKIKNKFFHSF